jgi:hypothetical protein
MSQPAGETNKILRYIASERINKGVVRMLIDALKKESDLDLSEIKNYMKKKYGTLFESEVI